MRPQTTQIITPPSEEPITVAQAKAHCRIDIDDDDTYLSGLIAAARSIAETETGRYLISQVVEAKYSDWPETGNGIWLPGPPLASVTSVKYYDADGTEQTLSTSVYEADTASEPGQVFLKPGQTWPTLQADKHLPITIRFTAGYADAATLALSQPQIITGIMMCVADWYRTRENQLMGNATKVPYGATTLFGQCAVPWGF